MLHPTERVTANFGYTVSSVQGQSELLNPRQVQGSLQSLYETPFARIAVTLRPRLVWKAEWVFKEYNESSPVGPTAPATSAATSTLSVSAITTNNFTTQPKGYP